MSSTPDKITVSQFAKMRGVSAQSVYKRLSTTLQPYVIIENGKKYVSILALSIPERETLTTVVNEEKQPLSTSFNPAGEEFLKEQIREKDEQIKTLFKQIDEANARNNELLRLLEQSQIIFHTEQKKQLAQPTEEKQEDIQPTEKKTSLFSRIFHKTK